MGFGVRVEVTGWDWIQDIFWEWLKWERVLRSLGFNESSDKLHRPLKVRELMGKAGSGQTSQNSSNFIIRTFRRTIHNSKDRHSGFPQNSSGHLCPVTEPVKRFHLFYVKW